MVVSTNMMMAMMMMTKMMMVTTNLTLYSFNIVRFDLIAELNLEDAMNRQSFLNLNHNPYAASSSDNKRSKWSDIISNVING